MRLYPTGEFWKTVQNTPYNYPQTKKQGICSCLKAVSGDMNALALWFALYLAMNAPLASKMHSCRESHTQGKQLLICRSHSNIWVRHSECWLHLLTHKAASFKCGPNRSLQQVWLWYRLSFTQSMWPSRCNVYECIHSGVRCFRESLESLHQLGTCRLITVGCKY
jgi:hypothetical protein